MAGGVEEAANEGFPAGHELNFIQKKCDWLRRGFREKSEVDVGDEMEIGGFQPGQALILKVEIDQPGGRTANGKKVGAALMEETGFSSPAHADDGKSLAWNGGKEGIAPGEWRWRMLDSSRHFLTNDLIALDLHRIKFRPHLDDQKV